MNRRPRARSPSWWPIAWCLAVAAPAFALVLRDGVYVGNGTDMYSYQLPMRELVRAIVGEGDLPWWNPSMLGGVPLFAGWQLGIAYPPNLLGLAAPASTSIPASLSLHIVWLAAGGFVLGQLVCGQSIRTFGWSGAIAAALFALCGPTWGHLFAGHVSYVQAWAWTPWIWAGVIAVLRQPDVRFVALLGGAVAMQLLAGHPQVSYQTAVGLLFVAAATGVSSHEDAKRPGSRAWAALGLAGLCGLGLAAVQWVPSATLAPLLNRKLANVDQLPLSFSAPEVSLWTALAADAFGGAKARLAGFSYHESLAHVGAAGLGLALLGAVRARLDRSILLVGAALFVLFSLGSHGPVLEPLVGIVPGLGAFRVPPRWVAPAIGLLAILAAQAVGESTTAQPSPTVRWVAALCALGVAGLCAVKANSLAVDDGWWRPWLDRAARYPPAVVGAAAKATRQELGWSAAVIGALGLGFALQVPTRRLAAAAAVVALVEGWVFAGVHVDKPRFVPKSAVTWSGSLVDAMRDRSHDGRIGTMSRLRQANWGGQHGLALAGGYEPAVPLWTNRYANHFAGRRSDRYAVNLQVRKPSAWLDRMATRRLVHRRGDRSARRFGQWPAVARSGSYVVRANPAPTRRMGPAGRVLIEPNRERALERIGHIGADEVLLQERLPGNPNAPIDVAVVERTANATRLDVNAQGDGVLVVRDAWLPGWTATVDGQAAQTTIADALFVAVAVPAGKHRVELSYTPPGLPLGLALSALTALALAIAWRRRTGQGAP